VARSRHFAGTVPVVEVEQQCSPFVELCYLSVLERPMRLSALMIIPERTHVAAAWSIHVAGAVGDGHCKLSVKGLSASVERPSHWSLSVYITKSAKERGVVVEVWRYLPSAKRTPVQTYLPIPIHLASCLHLLSVADLTAPK
jgi:hypothetical protein